MRNCLVHINYVNHNPILPNIPADGQRAQGTWSFARRYNNNNNINININNNAPSSNGQSLLSFPGFPPSGRRKILSYLQILGPTEIADLLRLAEFYSVLRCPEYTTKVCTWKETRLPLSCGPSIGYDFNNPSSAEVA